MSLTLRWIGLTRLPVEGEALRPDLVAGRSADEVARSKILVGNRPAEVGELFKVEGEGDGLVVFEGDVSSVRRIGRGMVSESIVVDGDAGPGLGSLMQGGAIEVRGSVGDSCGSGMRGGMIRVEGKAGDNLGGAEPGARLGMREGVILVGGAIGGSAGLAMRRGLIAVGGSSGEGLGRSMVAGSIFAFGAVGRDCGSGMKRGSLALFGPEPGPLGPRFAPSGRDRPTFVTLYLRRLREWGFPVPEEAFSGAFSRYNGDRAEGGQGEILVADSS